MSTVNMDSSSVITQKQYNGMTYAKEKEVTNFWKKNSIYENSIRNGPVFNFTDGPPFVSSDTLHFGHIAIGDIKSTIQMFKTQNGFKAENKLGFDCHGVPTETRACKDLNIKSNEIKDFGIDKFCNSCSDMIDRYSDSWNTIYDMMGRGYSNNNKYYTKDTNFMESVIWSFKQLYDKGLVRQGYGVHPYSIGCQTVLSAWEAKEKYQQVTDLSLFVKFKVRGSENTYFLAWTTTPWTLPSNLALCVNANTEYIKVKDLKTNEYYYFASSNIQNVYGKKAKKDKDYTIEETVKGSDLVGKQYEPLYNIFSTYTQYNCFQIYSDDFVKTEEEDNTETDFESVKKQKSKSVGTGIVHMAPAFGQDDFRVCNQFLSDSLIAETCIIDDSGCFTDKFAKFNGMLVFDCNNTIAQDLETNIFKKQEYSHRYPFCDRTKTRIVYRVVDVIFITATKLKDRMIELNKTITWYPEKVGSTRFQNWLEDTRDWAVSRTRYFGTPIPMWVSDDGSEVKVFGSIQEIQEASGIYIKDLHRQYLDNIIIKSESGKLLRRVPYVFDCWFDSGCVPFAQMHYPFENSSFFDDKEYLSDLFIEGIDQTRGWFYSTLVLSTALFNKANSNTIVACGIILAEDGKKMSKREKNYTDPDIVINEYTSDAMRLYLIGSPILRAEPMKFSEKFLTDIRKKITPLSNSVNLLQDYISMIDSYDKDFIDGTYKLTNVSDKWIVSKTNSLAKNISDKMEEYKINDCVDLILEHIDNFCNWYLKLNRSRIKDLDFYCISTFLNTLHKISIIITPFMPFTGETIYKYTNSFKNGPISTLLCDWPLETNVDKNIELSFKFLQDAIIEIRNVRSNSKNFTSVKKPIKDIKIFTRTQKELDLVNSVLSYIKKENNILHIVTCLRDLDSICTTEYIPDRKNIGIEFGKQSGLVTKLIQESKSSNIIWNGTELVKNKHFTIKTSINLESDCEDKNYMYLNNCLFEINLIEDDEVQFMYLMRCMNSIIQQSRGKFGFKPIDNVTCYINFENTILTNIIDFKQLEEKTNSKIIISNHKNSICDSIDTGKYISKINIFAELN